MAAVEINKEKPGRGNFVVKVDGETIVELLAMVRTYVLDRRRLAACHVVSHLRFSLAETSLSSSQEAGHGRRLQQSHGCACLKLCEAVHCQGELST